MIQIKPFGEHAILLSVGDVISRVTNARVMNYYQAFKELSIPGVDDLIPAYTSLTLIYNPHITSYDEVVQVIEEIEVTDDYYSQITVQLPICYHQEMAPDLERLSQFSGLSISEVIQLHLDRSYQVFMMGFLPGFLYMGEVNQKIQIPRRDTPRKQVVAGSVGIAGGQTGIYPTNSPGGWNIIGRCPVKLFDPKSHSVFPLQVGDQVQFHRIDLNEYDTIFLDKNYKIERLNGS